MKSSITRPTAKGIIPYLVFIIPPLFLYALLNVYPIGASLFYSVTDFRGIARPVLQGFQHYVTLAQDQNYWTTVKNVGVLLASTVAIQIPLALIIGYMLFLAKAAKQLFRLIVFMPMIISPIAIGLMFSIFYNPDFGLLNALLTRFGLSGLIRPWTSAPGVVLAAVIVPTQWRLLGLYAVIFLAAFNSISTEIFDSARIDGATGTQVFFRLSLPMISEILLLTLILSCANSFKAFDIPWAITAGGPGYNSAFMTIYVYTRAFSVYRFDYASAITVTILLYSVFLAVLIRLAGRIRK